MKFRYLLPVWMMFSFLSEVSYSGEYHYKDILIGERASGLGGTFTAISDDPSGVYYNPAGLIYAFENYLSGSANTFVSTKSVSKDVLGGQPYTISSSGMSPTFFGFSQSLGKGKFGFAVITPDSESINQDDRITGLSSGPDTPESFSRKYFRTDTTYLFGPAYALSVGQRTSLGISLLGFARTDRAIDNQFVRYAPDATGKYLFQNVALDREFYGMVPKIGIQHMWSDRLALGATLSKRVLLSSSSVIRATRTKTDPITGLPVADPGGAFSQEVEILEDKTQPTLQAPWVGTLGGTWFFDKTLLLSAEVNYHSADSNFRDYRLTPTLNWSVGSEWFLSEQFALRLGVYTNRANTPTIDSNSTNQPDHVDMTGGSIGLSFLKPGSSFTLGASYASGTGKGQAIAGTTLSQELTRTTLAISLSGSYQL